MKRMDIEAKLGRMAAVDLHTPGKWSVGTANNRCREYANLLSELLPLLHAQPAPIHKRDGG